MADQPLRLTSRFLKPRFLLYAIGVLLIMIAASLSGEYFYNRYLLSDWRDVDAQSRLSLTNEVQARFAAYQERTTEATKAVAYSSVLASSLTSGTDASIVAIFDELAIRNRMNLSFELYDSTERLLAWSGTHSSVPDSVYFSSSVATLIIPGPILSYFVTVVPVRVDSVQYYVVGKRLFDVNYPISNRFISNQAFATTFTSRFPFDLDYYFSSGAARDSSERIRIPLAGLSCDTLGYVYAQAPVLAEYQDTAHEFFGKIIGTAIVLAFALILFLALSVQRARGSHVTRMVVWTLGIWALRYIMVWRDFPECLFSSTLFDASYFASPFGFGLAKSIADLNLSALFLLANVCVIAVPWIRRASSREALQLRTPAAVLVVVALSSILFVCFRGFLAALASAVHDSSLPYGDPTFVLPSFELGAMLLGLLEIALALVILGAAIVMTLRTIFLSLFGVNRPAASWISTIAVLSALSVLFGALSPNPLLSQDERFIFVLLLAGLSILFDRIVTRNGHLQFVPASLATVIVAICFLIPVMDNNVHELDRIHAELLSSEILRPSDTWVKIVMQRALDELSNGDALAALSTTDRQGIEKLAFTQWAKSILSKEGSNCAILIFDQSGTVLSNFQIGISPYKANEPFQDISPTRRYIDVEDQKGNGDRRFMGYTPIFGTDGVLIGGVWVELATGRQTILRDETANLLKNYTHEHFEAHYRRLSISEYLQGKLVSTTDESIPLDHRLPAGVQSRSGTMQWWEESIDGVSYETLYLRDQTRGADNTWIALRMNALGFRWHVFSYLRYILFYALIVIGLSTVILVYQLSRRRVYFANFRSKLLTAFMIVSLLPIGVLAYYNRQYVLERADESVQKRLSDQTALVLSSIQREFEVNAPFTLSQVTNYQCTSVADRIDCDFIIYNDKYLQASSKPEIFTAELLDERLSAEAFVNMYVRKKSFYSEHRSIGSFPYIVGYRPIATESGAIIGVVSVPTLFRQNEIDEELTQRNVLLFGAYALALLLSLAVGTFFANQISSPILRLKDATKRLAEGDWNVRLRSGRKDELGDLEHSFDDMATRLRESQEQMLAAQREAAWKEMAKQVAHEIKNPLTPIKLSIQHLRRAFSDNVKDFGNVLGQVSATILQQIETLSRIASEFSNFARMPERKLAYSDVHEILDEARHLFDQHRAVSFTTDYRAAKSIILVDREELRRAFINILRNAIQAMKEKGNITIRTDSDVDVIDINITDSGPGIPPEVRDRLFEPNFSTKTDGMGLGLSIVKKTVDDLGGTIAIDSAPGTGTTVTMRLLLSLEHE
ncbi:MAG TPA: ATP-binding protein [Bacteroidota bacterium]|nr:ATP-binding protein [Bacteroidota bacterium]